MINWIRQILLPLPENHLLEPPFLGLSHEALSLHEYYKTTLQMVNDAKTYITADNVAYCAGTMLTKALEYQAQFAIFQATCNSINSTYAACDMASFPVIYNGTFSC